MPDRSTPPHWLVQGALGLAALLALMFIVSGLAGLVMDPGAVPPRP